MRTFDVVKIDFDVDIIIKIGGYHNVEAKICGSKLNGDYYWVQLDYKLDPILLHETEFQRLIE
jgi:hypothetical protein